MDQSLDMIQGVYEWMSMNASMCECVSESNDILPNLVLIYVLRNISECD